MRTFSYTQSGWQKLRHIYKQRLYNLLVDRRASMLLKPTDIISVRPTVLGYHEPSLEALIRDLAGEYGDFFLDIGANIGLSSIMVGELFRRIDCVEPNPLMINILRTNIVISGLDNRAQIHDFALGQIDGRSELFVPAKNYGAAYIADNNPCAGSGMEQRLQNAGEATPQTIEVRGAAPWFRELFASYALEDYAAGIIKIDAEGYEPIILEGLLETMPAPFRAVVILENFLPNFDTDRFAPGLHDLCWQHLAKVKRPVASLPFKLLGLSSAYRHELRPLNPHTRQPHDVVVSIN